MSEQVNESDVERSHESVSSVSSVTDAFDLPSAGPTLSTVPSHANAATPSAGDRHLTMPCGRVPWTNQESASCVE